jgi:hypothetical protein
MEGRAFSWKFSREAIFGGWGLGRFRGLMFIMQEIRALGNDSHPSVDVMEESGSARYDLLGKSSVSDQALHLGKVSSYVLDITRYQLFQTLAREQDQITRRHTAVASTAPTAIN